MDQATYFPRLFEPLGLGGVTIHNRIVNTTHSSSLPQDRDLAYLQHRARGGVALMGLSGGPGVLAYSLGPGTAGGVYEWDRKPPSPLTSEGVAYYDGLAIPYLEARAKVIHAEGAHCFAQVAHGGAAQHWPTMTPALGPSNVPDPYDAHVPHALSETEVEELIFTFAQGIRRVRDAGVDLAEIHGAHGYMLMQFLSPHFNRREDAWGGTREKRVRIVREIIAAARRLVGSEFPIGLRLGYEGFGQGRGINLDEACGIARLLAPHVAYISVSGGSYSGFGDGFEGAYVSPWYREPAYNAEAAAAVREAAGGVPVLVTGRIADASIAEALIREGAADMVGMVRALIADPDLPNKARAGQAGEIRMCLGLSECHHIGRSRVAVTCAVNAAAGREAEMAVTPAEVRKTVLVIGAGPAGLEASRVAALRGHKVYLCDEASELGGTVRVLARDPNRRNLLDQAAFFETALAPLDVELVLGHRVSADYVAGFEADAVIVATGAQPIIPEIPGLPGDPRVVTALQVLRGEVEVGARALVVGGADNHLAAPTLADYLAELGCEVELASEQVDFAAGGEDGVRFALLKRLKNKRVRLSLCTRLAELDGGVARLVDTFSGEVREVLDVTVVLACGMRPDDRLYRELHGRVAALQLVGDALAPRRIMHATVEGARAALAI